MHVWAIHLVGHRRNHRFGYHAPWPLYSWLAGTRYAQDFGHGRPKRPAQRGVEHL